MARSKKTDYFQSSTFKRKADEVAGQGITVISGSRAKRMHENYLKNQRKSSKKGK